MIEEKKNEALEAEGEYKSAVEDAYDYVENFDILETITNVGNDEVFTLSPNDGIQLAFCQLKRLICLLIWF